MSTQRRVAYKGQMFTIAFARDHSGGYPAEEFFDQLGVMDKAKLLQLFRILGDHGKHTNLEKFGDLGDGLFEFKSFQIRMPFTYATDEKRVILITHGFLKKRDKAPPAEIARARRILAEDAIAAKVLSIEHKPRKRQS